MSFRQDLRFAARGLIREPLFTVFVCATLALGIGANAAMYDIADRLLLTGPAHISDPARVMRVYRTVERPGTGASTGSVFGYVLYDLLRTEGHSFDGVAAYIAGPNQQTLLGRAPDAERVKLGQATADLFPTLGVQPVAGRFFSPEEDKPNEAQRVVVLSYGLWQRSFGADRGVVGRTVLLNDSPYTVVGVAPQGFTGPQLGTVDVWLPISLLTTIQANNWQRTWNAQWLQIVTRLKPGVTPEQAALESTTLYQRAYDGGDAVQAAGRIFVAPLSADNTGREGTEVTISRWLLGVAAIVLLIACSNVVNLLLARAVRRRRELAVRVALGAGRGRLVRLLLSESLMLAGLAGALGVGVAWFSGRLIRATLLTGVDWSASPVHGRVLLVLGAITLGVGVLVGLVPALRATNPALASSLKAGVREGGGQSARLRSALTVAQATLSIVLLVGAGLFVRSLGRVRALDLGLEPDRVLVVSPRWPAITATDAAERTAERVRRNDVFPAMLERVRGIAGVERASVTVGLPFQSSFGVDLRVAGWDSIPQLDGGDPNVSAVTSDYFETVGTRLLRGRAFTSADREGSEPIAIVSETMASTLWPGRDAIGECLFIGDAPGKPAPCSRIVGVVANARRFRLQEAPSMHYYIPLGQEKGQFGGSALLVRPRGDAATIIPAIQAAVEAVDPSVSYVDQQMLQQSVDPQIRPWRLGATVFGFMGVLALIVAAVGLYSVMSYLVAQRRHEIGVRIALGAGAGNILGLVFRSSVAMAALGVGLGLVISMWAGRFIAPLLFQTSPHDPVVLGGVAAMLLAVAVLASLVPALRARGVDPMEALRSD